MRSAMHSASSVGDGGDAPLARTRSDGDGKEETRPRLGDDNMGRGRGCWRLACKGLDVVLGKEVGFPFFVIGFRIWIIY